MHKSRAHLRVLRPQVLTCASGATPSIDPTIMASATCRDEGGRRKGDHRLIADHVFEGFNEGPRICQYKILTSLPSIAPLDVQRGVDTADGILCRKIPFCLRAAV